MKQSAWYGDWQNTQHAANFDARSRLDAANLFRDYESFNDVRLLNERVDPAKTYSLLEVGCATGEFHRYLGLKHPNIAYRGFDISAPAIERAKAKYPQGDFRITDPSLSPALAARGATNLIEGHLLYGRPSHVRRAAPRQHR